MPFSTCTPFKIVQFLCLLLSIWVSACSECGQKGSERSEVDVDTAQKEAIANTLAKTDTTAPGKLRSTLLPATDPDVDEKNVLYPGQSLWAGGGGLRLDGDDIEFGARLTEDGAFILYNSGDRLWTAKTKNASPGYELIMQDDGNLVLYDRSYQPIWSSETHGYYGGEKYRTADWRPVKLVLEPNLLVLYSATGRKVWNNEVGEISSLK